jgi:hypothetical protein
MRQRSREGHIMFLLIVGLMGWFVPGAGHLMLKEKKHAIIIFITIALTFATGLYIGSIGIINPVGAKPWYVAQIMNSPAVAVLGQLTRMGDYPVYGRPNEIGQIYTSIAGLLNLLCIVNAVYWAHLRKTGAVGE